MKTSGRRWGLVIVVVAVIVVALLCCVALAGALGLWVWSSRPASGYSTNGEQIFVIATSQRGTSITSEGGGGTVMMGGRLACVNCHGADGRGGQRRMMMRSFEAPDIRYRTLTAPRVNEKGEAEPIFDDATIKQAITRGVDPDGAALAWPMPRWSMSAADLDDLLNYLKALP